MEKPIKQEVEEFKKIKPDSAKLTFEECEEISRSGNMLFAVNMAFNYGYMRGMNLKNK